MDINPYLNEEETIQYRLYSILQIIYSDKRYNPYIDLEVEEKVLEFYLKNYSDYQYAK